MHFFKCDDLQAWTGGKWYNLNTAKRPDIHGFGTDSRAMEKDFAFVAIKAARDGHDFAADAVANGASAVIAERELDVGVPVLVVNNALRALQRIAKMHRLRFEWPVIGITGSCGKTSTKEMLAKLISWKNPLYTEKNFNNELGVPLTLLKMDSRQNQAAIIEAGVSAPGQMKELAEMIEPDLAIITNVGLAHLEKFQEVGNVAKEKAVLASKVAVGGWALFHHNLLSWKAFDELKCKKAVVASSEAPDIKADLVFRYSIVDNGETLSVDMSVEGGAEYLFEIKKMSEGMVDNALLCIAAALIMGTKEEQIAGKLEQISPLPMRGSVVEDAGVKWYLDCYNASPTSMKDALAFFAKISKNSAHKMYVLGSMAELGLGTHRHHKEIGYNLPHSDGDIAVLIGANAEIYKMGMLEAKNWNENEIFVFPTAQDAKNKVSEFKDGAIFVKGSRVCELEKLVPENVINLALNPLAEPEVEMIEEPYQPETQKPESKNDDGEYDDEGDEFQDDFDADSDEDFEDENSNNTDEDDEDERF